MTQWTQYTYVNGVLRYEPKQLTMDKMLSRFAQFHFLRQDGEDITVDVEQYADSPLNTEVAVYVVTRKMTNRTVVHRYVRN